MGSGPLGPPLQKSKDLRRACNGFIRIIDMPLTDPDGPTRESVLHTTR